MRLIVHDLKEEDFGALGVVASENAKGAGGSGDTQVIAAAAMKAAPCQGCFGCWLKLPGYCVLKDSLQHMGALFGRADEVVLISEAVYGGFSEPVKRVLDRSISISLPFFTYRGGKMRHMRRYKNKPRLTFVLYGDITESEKAVAQGIVDANKSNGGYEEAKLLFAAGAADVGRCLA